MAPKPPSPRDDPVEEDDAATTTEPQLRYERLGGDLKSILAEERAGGGRGSSVAVTALSLSSKLLALGTSDGAVAIMDYSGNMVRRGSAWGLSTLCARARGRGRQRESAA